MGHELSVENLVSMIVNSLVDNPDEVDIKTLATESGITFEVRVAPSDVGKLIGKQGRLARAIRGLLMSIGAASKTSYWLNIIDTNGGSGCKPA